MLTEIDLSASLKDKFDVDVDPQVILGVRLPPRRKPRAASVKFRILLRALRLCWSVSRSAHETDTRESM